MRKALHVLAFSALLLTSSALNAQTVTYTDVETFTPDLPWILGPTHQTDNRQIDVTDNGNGTYNFALKDVSNDDGPICSFIANNIPGTKAADGTVTYASTSNDSISVTDHGERYSDYGFGGDGITTYPLTMSGKSDGQKLYGKFVFNSTTLFPQVTYRMTFVFGTPFPEDATGINTINSATRDSGKTYTYTGVNVTGKKLQKGVYIRNGKKFLVK